MRNIKVILSVLLSIMLMTFIFILSAQNSGDSGSLSESVARLIAMVFVPGFDSMELDTQANILNMLWFPVRKLAHATEYACLAISLVNSCWQVLSANAEKNLRDIDVKSALLKAAKSALIITVIYACTDEFHQLYIDGRAGQIFDVCVDSIGAALGTCVATLIAYRFLQKRGRYENDEI